MRLELERVLLVQWGLPLPAEARALGVLPEAAVREEGEVPQVLGAVGAVVLAQPAPGGAAVPVPPAPQGAPVLPGRVPLLLEALMGLLAAALLQAAVLLLPVRVLSQAVPGSPARLLWQAALPPPVGARAGRRTGHTPLGPSL